MGGILALLPAAGFVSAAGAVRCVATASVPTSAPCVNPNTYTTLQSAVDSASTGDEIRIAAGTYTAPGALHVVEIFYKVLALRGGFTPGNWQSPTATGPTIIDGQDARTCVQVFDASEATLERLTLTHGHTNNNGGAIDANMFPASGPGLNLIDVIITENTAGYSGAGLFVTGGTAHLSRTLVSNNTAGQDGGGFFGLGLSAKASAITHNTAARYGGGAFVFQASFDQSQVVGNTASSGDGGGLHFNRSSTGGTLVMTQTQVIDNTAGNRGGGMYLGGMASVRLSWSLLGDNNAAQADALLVDPVAAAPSQITLQNVTITRSTLSPRSAIQLGVLIPSDPATLTLTNTVVTSHTVAIARQGTINIGGDYNAFFGNLTNQTVNGAATPLPFTHMISADPQFANPASGDFHLRAASPLRDAADPALSYAGQYDLEGTAIPVGGAADIGAYEYGVRDKLHYLPLIQR